MGSAIDVYAILQKLASPCLLVFCRQVWDLREYGCVTAGAGKVGTHKDKSPISGLKHRCSRLVRAAGHGTSRTRAREPAVARHGAYPGRKETWDAQICENLITISGFDSIIVRFSLGVLTDDWCPALGAKPSTRR